MSDIVDFYHKEAAAGLSAVPWLSGLQSAALNDFLHWDFPTRHNEEWKYTGLDRFLKHNFAKSETPATTEPSVNMPFKPHFIIHNAHISAAKPCPSGLSIKPLKDALATHAEIIKPLLGTVLNHEHAFHALNTAALQTGLFIHIPAHTVISEPIIIAHTQDADEQAAYVRHLILAEEGSQAVILETYEGREDCAYFTSTVTEACLLADAKITHYKIQNEGRTAFHIGHLAVRQAAQSVFESHVLSLGGSLVRSDLSICLEEARAECLMNGLYIPSGKQHMDFHTSVHHAVPGCSSTQDYKGVLSEAAKAVFNGKVIVAKDAQHTRAAQQNKNLLLSSKAEVNTKPQLDIFADDVVCSHGATVGQLDEDALFYLAARGIGKKEARRYLIEAFAADNLRSVREEAIKKWMSELIKEQLG